MKRIKLWYQIYRYSSRKIKLSAVINTASASPIEFALVGLGFDIETFDEPFHFGGIHHLDLTRELENFPAWTHDFNTLDLDQLVVQDIQLHRNHPRSFTYQDEKLAVIVHKHGLSLSTPRGLVNLAPEPYYTADPVLNRIITSVMIKVPMLKD